VTVGNLSANRWRGQVGSGLLLRDAEKRAVADVLTMRRRLGRSGRR
jgi:hypothetical protein